MTIQVVFYALLISLSYLSWPMMGKYTGTNGVWLAFIVTLIAPGVIAVLALVRGQLTVETAPDIKAISIISLAAIVNAVAVYVAAQLSVNPTVPIGIFYVALSVIGVLISALLGFLLFGELLAARQLLGLLLGIATIYLLK